MTAPKILHDRKKILNSLKAQVHWHQWHGIDAKCPCDNCDVRDTCRSAWDIYNDDDSCLEDK